MCQLFPLRFIYTVVLQIHIFIANGVDPEGYILRTTGANGEDPECYTLGATCKNGVDPECYILRNTCANDVDHEGYILGLHVQMV